MNNRAVGVSFCFLATILFLSRYFLAILYRGFDPKVWGPQEFRHQLSSISMMPWILAGVALVAGIFYLAKGDK